MASGVPLHITPRRLRDTVLELRDTEPDAKMSYPGGGRSPEYSRVYQLQDLPFGSSEVSNEGESVPVLAFVWDFPY